MNEERFRSGFEAAKIAPRNIICVRFVDKRTFACLLFARRYAADTPAVPRRLPPPKFSFFTNPPGSVNQFSLAVSTALIDYRLLILDGRLHHHGCVRSCLSKLHPPVVRASGRSCALRIPLRNICRPVPAASNRSTHPSSYAFKSRLKHGHINCTRAPAMPESTSSSRFDRQLFGVQRRFFIGQNNWPHETEGLADAALTRVLRGLNKQNAYRNR